MTRCKSDGRRPTSGGRRETVLLLLLPYSFTGSRAANLSIEEDQEGRDTCDVNGMYKQTLNSSMEWV
jgi:hypothetical protein